jgi:hypothetical protein
MPKASNNAVLQWALIAAAVAIIAIIAIVVGVTRSSQARIGEETSIVLTNVAVTHSAELIATANAAYATATQAMLNGTMTQAALNASATFAAANQTATFFANATSTQAAINVTQTFQARPPNTSTPVPPAIIQVTNKGGFVVRFSVDYTTSAGPQKISADNIQTGSTASAQIPGNATAIVVTIEEFTGFSWRDNPSCTRSLSAGTSYAFTISGTTFDATCAG